jgi:group II intron reverse transcriptase/maturase
VRVLQRKLYRAAKADGRRTFGVLYDKVCRRDVLEEAWKRVKAAGGGPGADGQSLQDTETAGVQEFLDGIEAELRNKRYRPEVVLRRHIPKPGKPGETRPLGIPVIRDRVIQMAVKLVIEPLFEADFLDCSYGFRPRRSAHDAMRDIRRVLWQQRKLWVCDVDLKSCFDSIPHEPLIEALRRRIRDPWVLRLIRRWLKAGILDKGTVSEPEAGAPQGAVLSPLLSNVYLHTLDQQWAGGGADGRGGLKRAHLVRYADDLVLLSRTESLAQESLQELRALLDRLGLRLNEQKSRIVHAREGFEFLGFHVRWVRSTRSGRMFPLWRPRRAAVQRVKARLKARAKAVPLNEEVSELIRTMNTTLQSWSGYFCYSNATPDFVKVDRFARTQVRIWLCRKHRYRAQGWLRYSGPLLHGTLGLHCLVQNVRSGARHPNAPRRSPSVSRVRENRTHGSMGGPRTCRTRTTS